MTITNDDIKTEHDSLFSSPVVEALREYFTNAGFFGIGVAEECVRLQQDENNRMNCLRNCNHANI